jgi:organic hydroperoxide reductase OsmC/OhrA
MAVIASRQPGVRPETIRTRLARFMPTRAAAGWTVGWSTQTERPEEIADDDQLRAAEHLGCYGAAVAHALAQAEIAPLKLRVTAEADVDSRTDEQTITLEVRAQCPGIDQTVLEAIARRAEPTCGVWKGLMAENAVRVIGILEEPGAGDPSVAVGESAAGKGGASAAKGSREQVGKPGASQAPAPLKKFTLPKWLTMRLAVLTAVALATFASVPVAGSVFA